MNAFLSLRVSVMMVVLCSVFVRFPYRTDCTVQRSVQKKYGWLMYYADISCNIPSVVTIVTNGYKREMANSNCYVHKNVHNKKKKKCTYRIIRKGPNLTSTDNQHCWRLCVTHVNIHEITQHPFGGASRFAVASFCKDEFRLFSGFAPFFAFVGLLLLGVSSMGNAATTSRSRADRFTYPHLEYTCWSSNVSVTLR